MDWTKKLDESRLDENWAHGLSLKAVPRTACFNRRLRLRFLFTVIASNIKGELWVCDNIEDRQQRKLIQKYISLRFFMYSRKIFFSASDWKNNNNQTCSCPRDERFSASWGPNWELSLKPLGPWQHYRIEGIRGSLFAPSLGREALVSQTGDGIFPSMVLEQFILVKKLNIKKINK